MSRNVNQKPTPEMLEFILKMLRVGSHMRLVEDRPEGDTFDFSPEVSRAVAAAWEGPIVRPETIVAAAVQIEGLTVSLPRPAGHGEVLALMSEGVQGYDPGLAGAMQGFLTSEGRFVSRVEALKIAHRAGQPFRTPPRPPNLFSEDLW